MMPPEHVWIWFTLLFTVALAMTVPQTAQPRELYPGQYADVDPAIQFWFRSQKVPGGPNKGMSCCNEADGVYAEEDIVNNHYFARWRIQGALTAWLRVPDDAILPHSNRNGSPVVWWNYRNGNPNILCFAPGGGV